MEGVSLDSMKKIKRSLVVPSEILSQIFLQLPIKTLSKFKCVSKKWIYLLEDHKFVDSHRIRSQIQSRHVRILELYNDHNYEDRIGYQDEEEGPEPCVLFIQDPDKEFLEAKKISLQISSLFLLRVSFYYPGETLGSVEGLVCFDNLVMNPSTREVIEVPKLEGNWDSYDGSCSYYLGFDGHSKTYKVLAFPRIDYEKDPNDEDYYWNTSGDEFGSCVSLHGGVMTLGATNLWRSVIFPKKLVKNRYKSSIILAHLSVDNKIFILVSPNHFGDPGKKQSLLIFGIKDEKFIGVIKELPWGLHFVNPLEVKGKLAMMESWVLNNQRALWILDDYDLIGNATWIKRTLLFKEGFLDSLPICTIHNEDAIEILFKTFKWRSCDNSFYFYYNMKTNNIRVSNGSTYHNDKNRRLLNESGHHIIWHSKYIETMFKLKLRL